MPGEEIILAETSENDFLKVLSHEFRTPLSVIIGCTTMIKNKVLGDINPHQERALEKVLTCAGEQLDVIKRIVQTTRLETRAVAAEARSVDLTDVMAEMRSHYENAPKNGGVALVWEYSSDPIPITTDTDKLKQILQDLIDNALKFTDEGMVTVSAKIVSRPPLFQFLAPENQAREPRLWAEIGVSDTGIGIPGEKLNRIFEKFYQVDTADNRSYGGAGLGLYIVKKLTEILGGKVRVESEIGRGSTFTVTLPCASKI